MKLLSHPRYKELIQWGRTDSNIEYELQQVVHPAGRVGLGEKPPLTDLCQHNLVQCHWAD